MARDDERTLFVEDFPAPTPPSAEAYRERAAQIAEHGYSAALN